jgi:citrate lyase subunit beta/citryl-CoA lyase
MHSPAPRSYLFVPGNRPDRFAKACAAGADAVIIDLEDAVPPLEKAAARAAIAAWLSPTQPVLVRVNSADSEWFREDVELCRTPGVAGIVLPKAERVEEIILLGEHVGLDTPVLPLIETAQGIWNAHALAQTRRVQRLLFGSIDFQLDLRITGEAEELLYFRSQLVLVSRVAGIQSPVDGVCQAIDAPEQLRADSLRARRLGFGGKLCIHPKQAAYVNECFSPSSEEVAWATRVLEAASTADGAAVAVDGKMVDRPVMLKAQEILKAHRGGEL